MYLLNRFVTVYTRIIINRDCVMASMLASSAVDHGFKPRSVRSPRVRLIMGSSPDWFKPKTVKLVCVASPVSTHHYKEKEQRLCGSESG